MFPTNEMLLQLILRRIGEIVVFWVTLGAATLAIGALDRFLAGLFVGVAFIPWSNAVHRLFFPGMEVRRA